MDFKKGLIIVSVMLAVSSAWSQSPTGTSTIYQKCATEKGISLPVMGSGNFLTSEQRQTLYVCVRKATHADCLEQAGITNKVEDRTQEEKTKLQQCMAMKGFSGHLLHEKTAVNVTEPQS